MTQHDISFYFSRGVILLALGAAICLESFSTFLIIIGIGFIIAALFGYLQPKWRP